MFSFKIRLGVGPDVAPRLQSFPSDPLPQRLSARDTNPYRQPEPATSDNYLTFWNGNQLPGSFMHVTPHAAWISVSSQDDTTPQFTGGSFGQVLTQLQSAQLVANWRNMWANLQGRYS